MRAASPRLEGEKHSPSPRLGECRLRLCDVSDVAIDDSQHFAGDTVFAELIEKSLSHTVFPESLLDGDEEIPVHGRDLCHEAESVRRMCPKFLNVFAKDCVWPLPNVAHQKADISLAGTEHLSEALFFGRQTGRRLRDLTHAAGRDRNTAAHNVTVALNECFPTVYRTLDGHRLILDPLFVVEERHPEAVLA